MAQPRHHVLLVEQADGLRRLVHSHGTDRTAWCRANEVQLVPEYARLGETPWDWEAVLEACRALGGPDECVVWSAGLLERVGVPLQDGAATKLWRATALRPVVV